MEYWIPDIGRSGNHGRYVPRLPARHCRWIAAQHLEYHDAADRVLFGIHDFGSVGRSTIPTRSQHSVAGFRFTDQYRRPDHSARSPLDTSQLQSQRFISLRADRLAVLFLPRCSAKQVSRGLSPRCGSDESALEIPPGLRWGLENLRRFAAGKIESEMSKALLVEPRSGGSPLATGASRWTRIPFPK